MGFNSTSGWNTHKPPTSSRGCSLGLRRGDFGRAGASCQPPPVEPASSECHVEKEPKDREEEVLWLPGLLPLRAFRCSESVWPFHLMAQPGWVPPVPSGVSPSVEVVLTEAREENYSQRLLRERTHSFVCVPSPHPVAQSYAECPQVWHRTRCAHPGAGWGAVTAAALQRPLFPLAQPSDSPSLAVDGPILHSSVAAH